MTATGVVREWRDDEGWGVIDSDVTPGGCWVHFSSLRVAGFKAVPVGGAVEFTFEPADQDGFAFRAVDAWPAGEAPVDDAIRGDGPSGAVQVTATLTFDLPDHGR
jgi:cold shock protein